jgi:hypothetical protein
VAKTLLYHLLFPIILRWRCYCSHLLTFALALATFTYTCLVPWGFGVGELRGIISSNLIPSILFFLNNTQLASCDLFFWRWKRWEEATGPLSLVARRSIYRAINRLTLRNIDPRYS